MTNASKGHCATITPSDTAQRNLAKELRRAKRNFDVAPRSGKDLAQMTRTSACLPRIREADERDVPTIIGLAHRIWSAHYPSIIGQAQIDYMLSRMYAPDTILKEMTKTGIRYDIAEVDGHAVGYSAYGPGPAPGEMKLHKLYVLPEHQGLGLGKALMRQAAAWGSANALPTIILAVNKRNERAVAAYRRCGFSIRESVVVDIGGGFVMDDYIMTSPISNLCRTASMV